MARSTLTLSLLAMGSFFASTAAAQDGAARTTGARDRATVIMPEGAQALASRAEYGYADAVVIDGTAYLSGVVVGLGGPGDTLEAAYDRAFKALGGILNRAGGSWKDVVDITSYHTDLTTQLKVMAQVKSRFVTAPFPAWTAIGVSRLVPDRGLTEIKLVARIGRAPKP